MLTQVPIPEFDPTVGAALTFLGVPSIFVLLVLTLLALDSWVSNAQRAARSAKYVGDAMGRGGVWLFKQRPARLVIIVAATVGVGIVQWTMLRLSYRGGSLVGMPFDPVRREAFNEVFDAPPSLFVDPVFLDQFLKLDAVSAIYMSLSALVIAYSYRSKSNTLRMALILSFPYCLFLFGAVSLAVITVAINGFFVLLMLPSGEPQDWTMVNTWVLANSYLALDLICAIYCITAFAAVYGARLVRRLWMADEDLRGNAPSGR